MDNLNHEEKVPVVSKRFSLLSKSDICDGMKTMRLNRGAYFMMLSLMAASAVLLLFPQFIIGDYIQMSVFDLFEFRGHGYFAVILMALYLVSIVIALLPLLTCCQWKARYLAPLCAVHTSAIVSLLYTAVNLTAMIDTIQSHIFSLNLEVDRTPLGVVLIIVAVFALVLVLSLITNLLDNK